ncbi:response regulator [Noviherbaspirillum massiliense]|uniref:response regulator n=1 Tax=Noviherbaspirillum massiliense TaxID=1465823 RepID=UPI0003178101|nr:response regulator transcription factor [Noviherbaspirillum massiliense]
MTTTVGIIEDNPDFLARFRGIIASHPEFTLVGSASSGADGIALINSQRADVYLVDLGLPDMHGTEVIRHAVSTWPGSEVMVITVFGDNASIMGSIEAGATGYLLKGSSPAEIIDSIRTLLAGGSPVSAAIARKILQKLQLEKSGPAEHAPAPHMPPAAAGKLTEREIQILRSLAKGLSNKEIGDSHQISAYTVAGHVKKIYRKLAVHSRGEAVYEATQMGLLK